jgi:hypothetical protein
MHYRVMVANISNVVASHIHFGPAGSNGPIVVFLFGNAPPGGGLVNGVLAEGSFTAADFIDVLTGHPMSDLLAMLQTDSGYVNVHTNDGIAPPTPARVISPAARSAAKWAAATWIIDRSGAGWRGPQGRASGPFGFRGLDHFRSRLEILPHHAFHSQEEIGTERQRRCAEAGRCVSPERPFQCGHRGMRRERVTLGAGEAGTRGMS